MALFQKGKPKTGGRKKGSPTRLAREVQAKMEELGCDPIEGMARLAMNESLDPGLRGKMFSELAQYVYPKRKSVEHSGPDGAPIETHDSAIELLSDRVDSIAATFRAGSSVQPVN